MLLMALSGCTVFHSERLNETLENGFWKNTLVLTS